MNRWLAGLTGALAVLVGTESGRAQAFDDWGFRMEVSFPGYTQGEPLTNFPVLLALSNNVGGSGFSYDDFASASGADLRFAASNATDELNYSIGSWNPNGVSYVWVQVPKLVASNDFIYAFWGNESATAPAYTTNGATWGAGFQGVWHMQDATNVIDSSGNANHGTGSTGIGSTSAGIAGNALSLNGSSHHVDCGTGLNMRTHDVTLSIWFKTSTTTFGAGLIGKTVYASAVGRYGLYRSGANMSGMAQFLGGGVDLSHAWNYSDGEWHQATVTYKRTGNMTVYVDGVQKGTASISAHSAYDMNPASYRFWIGAYGNSSGTAPQSGFYFPGQLDEARMLNVAVSSNWVWACWLNQSSNEVFAAFDEVQLQSDALRVWALEPAGVGATRATLNGRLGKIGEAENPELAFCWGHVDGGTNSGTSAWSRVTAMGTNWGVGESFSTNLTGLLSGSSYVYRCYATNSTGEAWSEEAPVFTTVSMPAVTNLGAVNGRAMTWLRGEVTETGGEPPHAWFLWWADGATETNVTAMGPQSGVFSNALEWLDPGVTYRCQVLASNDAGVVWSHEETFGTLADAWFVATNGSDAALGTSWAEAFLTISNALAQAVDDDTIWVSNGYYGVTATLTVTNRVRVKSVNGADAATVARATSAWIRVMSLSHAGAVVDGFTITNGLLGNAGQGPGVYLGNGTLKNCVVTSNTIAATVNAHAYGGGVYMTNGLVEDCLIAGNWAGANSGYTGIGYGGGVYMTSGTVRRCRITDNSSKSSSGYNNGRGGGVYMTGGLLENSLVVHNEGPGYGGGVVLAGAGARMTHCTVSDNRTYDHAGGGLFMSAGTVTDSIVYHNVRSYDQAHVNVFRSGGTVAYTCTTPLESGAGNLAGQPDYLDRAARLYRLRPGSACLDAASSGLGEDIDGTPRPLDGDGDGTAAPDMGAYEEQAPADRAFLCNFTAPVHEGVDELEVVFTAHASGSDTAGLTYAWDFTNDGTPDESGEDKRTVTNVYGPGAYTVALTVGNAAMGTTNVVKADYVRVLATTNYVATNGAHVFPFASWANASTTIHDAANAAIDGGVVLVDTGVYGSVAIQLRRGFLMRGIHGADRTVIRGGARVLLTHTGAVMEAITVTEGVGVTMTAGTFRDGVISSNYLISWAGTAGGGGGIRMDGGLLERSVIRHNHVYMTVNGSSYGGGIYLAGGLARDCLIAGNQATTHLGYGGQGYGGGVYLAGSGQLLNCTVTGNAVNKTTNPSGGGVHRVAGGITNTIVWDNQNITTLVVTNLSGTLTAGIGYTCAPELTGGSGNIAADPSFKSPGAGYGTALVLGDYRLPGESPCVDQGMTFPDMTARTDLAGNPRKARAAVDMGAYETPPVQGSLIMIR